MINDSCTWYADNEYCRILAGITQSVQNIYSRTYIAEIAHQPLMPRLELALEKPQGFGKEYPAKEGEAGDSGGKDNTVACQFSVTIHLLGHGKGDNGAWGTEDTDDGNKFYTPIAKIVGDRQDDAWDNKESGAYSGHQRKQPLGYTGSGEGSTQHNQGHRGGSSGNLAQWFQEGSRYGNAAQIADGAYNGADNHRVFQNALDDGPEVELSAPEGLQHNYA